MHPYYGKENASIPTGVEVREGLDEMDVGKILRYTKPDVTADYWSVSINESESIYNPARNLFYNWSDVLVQHGDPYHVNYEYFADALDELCNVGNIDLDEEEFSDEEEYWNKRSDDR